MKNEKEINERISQTRILITKTTTKIEEKINDNEWIVKNQEIIGTYFNNARAFLSYVFFVSFEKKRIDAKKIAKLIDAVSNSINDIKEVLK